jgi:predicted aminopeptidase
MQQGNRSDETKPIFQKKLTLALLALIILVLDLSGATGSCQVSYLAQAVAGHLLIIHARQSIAKILKSETLDTETWNKLKLVLEVRGFAISEEGLPDNKSYTLNAAIKGECPGWNVHCAPKFSVEPIPWSLISWACWIHAGANSPHSLKL